MLINIKEKKISILALDYTFLVKIGCLGLFGFKSKSELPLVGGQGPEFGI